MYKILHRLFGFDYIQYSFYYYKTVKARIAILPDGTIGFWIAGTFFKLYSPDHIIWLTCKPEKYFKPNKEIIKVL
jgi:hypothetical protein